LKITVVDQAGRIDLLGRRTQFYDAVLAAEGEGEEKEVAVLEGVILGQ
jgi:hypothetical protein